jgi:hypothetical protein
MAVTTSQPDSDEDLPRLRTAHARALRKSKKYLGQFSCADTQYQAQHLEQAGFYACLALEAVLVRIIKSLGRDPQKDGEAASAISQCEAYKLLTKAETFHLHAARRIRNSFLHRYSQRDGWTAVFEAEDKPAHTHIFNAHELIDELHNTASEFGAKILK